MLTILRIKNLALVADLTLELGAGYSTTGGILGDISVQERNLLGKGQNLRLEYCGTCRSGFPIPANDSRNARHRSAPDWSSPPRCR